MLPEFKRRLKKHLTPCNCAACRFFSNIAYTRIQVFFSNKHLYCNKSQT